MKKKYEKPQVCIETFYLSEHIAACNWVLNSAQNSCTTATGKLDGIDFDVIMFGGSANVSGCDIDEGGASCEYTPDGVASLMNS